MSAAASTVRADSAPDFERWLAERCAIDPQGTARTHALCESWLDWRDAQGRPGGSSGFVLVRLLALPGVTKNWAENVLQGVRLKEAA